MSAFDMKDGGFQSRKFIITIFSQVLIFGAALVAARWTAIGTVYETMCGALVACLAAFLGVNVASKWTIGKNIVALGKAHGILASDTPDGDLEGESETERGVGVQETEIHRTEIVQPAQVKHE